MDNREFLYPGDVLIHQGDTFHIRGTLRRGGTYVCYDAVLGGIPGRLKELYPGYFLSPAKSQYLILQRQRNHRLSGSNFVIDCRYKSICRDYGRAYRAILPNFPMGSFLVMESGSLWVWTPMASDCRTFREYVCLAENETQRLLIILRCIRDLAGGARRLHGAGLLHLDISPETIALDPAGNVILQDFDGIHPIGGGCIPLGGAEPYRAPEVTRGRAENRSDIYSIGAVLFYALFDSENVAVDRIRILIAGSPFLCAAAPKSHAFLRCMLEKILRKSLAPKPKDRYSCCEELIADLDWLISEFPPESSEEEPLYSIDTTDETRLNIYKGE